MKVRIGTLEVCDVTLDDLDELVKRYGGAVQAGGAGEGNSGAAAGGTAHSGSSKAAGSGHHHGNTADTVILRKLVEGGSQGVPTADLGTMLGRRGKATRGAAQEWAHRMGIVGDAEMEAFEESRVGTQRALRLKPSLLDIAKAHLPKP